jgi:hypothetical protein
MTFLFVYKLTFVANLSQSGFKKRKMNKESRSHVGGEMIGAAKGDFN